MIVKLFAGADGAGIGIARALPGVPSVGLEMDRDCCDTMAAAGLPVIQCDIAQYPTEPFVGRVSGLWASPPCTDFSAAGKRAGIEGKTGHLIYEVPRWVDALRPEWVVCEQVPEVLPHWRQFAQGFETAGYSTRTGILCAADYGTPQTRERAILLASRVRHVEPPRPTHAKHPHPVMFGESELPWVSMADALGWKGMVSAGDRKRATVRETSSPAPTVLVGTGSPGWTLNTRRDQREDGSTQVVTLDRPAPSVTTINSQWQWERPATTVQGDRRIAPPGHRDRAGGEPQFGPQTVRVTLEELATLQDFPAGWPFQGTKSSIARQIGNAVPSRLAEACVRAVA